MLFDDFPETKGPVVQSTEKMIEHEIVIVSHIEQKTILGTYFLVVIAVEAFYKYLYFLF